MSVSVAPSIFDVFNARQLTPEEVAQGFVPPPQHFAKLVKATHSLIVGPRGSGKTTLLKMLHPAALEAWNHDEAAHYRRQINYTGVFVATDRAWQEQMKSLGDGRLDSESHRQFAKAAFTTQILRALVESMLHRSGRLGPPGSTEHRRVHLGDREEKVVARELIETWNIDRAISSLQGIRLALTRRFSEIRVLASQEASRTRAGRAERIAELRFLHLDFLAAAAVAIEVFDTEAKEHGAKWAILFDELELAPEWIRSVLIQSLRSVDERFLFKISLSPYSVDIGAELEREHSPSPGQDFEPIRLWYVNKERGYPFCRDLLRSMLAKRELPPVEAEKLFGTSMLASQSEDERGSGAAYRAGTPLAIQFEELAGRDPSFREYLKRRRVDVNHMDKLDEPKRAAHVRKPRSIVALRAYFKGEGASLFRERAQGRRSRKAPTVYGGATSLFAMVEGNPRWFIGIVGELLSKIKRGKVSKADQVKHVRDAGDIFRAMLKTIPCGPIGGSRRGLLSLLDAVGNYFAYAAINAPFDPDPPCSFVVDRNTSASELTALGMALNAGAIVFVPDGSDIGILESLRGKRFRLSYILAPHYFVPLVLGRRLALGEILKRAPNAKQKGLPEPTLFTLGEDPL